MYGFQRKQLILGVLSLTLMLQGCTASEQSNQSCGEAMGEHLISYMGGMQGSGQMHLRAVPDGKRGAIEGNFTLFRSASDASQILIQLTGAGSCEHGVVRVNFGAVAGKNDEFRVVGGNLLGIFRPDIDPVPFGRWQIDFSSIEAGEQFSADGFWQIIDELPKPGPRLVNRNAELSLDAPLVSQVQEAIEATQEHGETE